MRGKVLFGSFSESFPRNTTNIEISQATTTLICKKTVLSEIIGTQHLSTIHERLLGEELLVVFPDLLQFLVDGILVLFFGFELHLVHLVIVLFDLLIASVAKLLLFGLVRCAPDRKKSCTQFTFRFS